MIGRKGRGGLGGVALLVVGCGGTIDLRTDSGGAASGGQSVAPSAGGKQSGSSGPDAGGEASAEAGQPGAGGVQTSPGPILMSSACGKPLPFDQVATVPGTRIGYNEWHVTQTGATLGADDPTRAGDRQFYVRVPADYDPGHPYRIVYLGSGCGAQHAGKTITLPLFNEAEGGDEQAIYVGLSVPDNDANPGCYDNNSGPASQEWEAFDLIHSFVEKTYCVDNNQIYVAGYSTGAWLSNMWGCYFAGTPSPPLDQPDLDAGRQQRKFSPHWAIRGHLGVAGALPPNQPVPCNGPAAGLWIHDAQDKSNLIATQITALNLALQTNGCTGNYVDGPKQPWPAAENIPGLAGGVCQQYTGCPAATSEAYPLVFCTTNGFGHSDQSPTTIPAFTKFMQLLAPAP